MPVFPLVGSMMTVSGAKATLTLGRFDHREADAVLNGACGIERLHLHEDGRSETLIEPRYLHQRRIAERVGQVFINARHMNA